MFSPLQVISSYSLLQSTLKIDDFVRRGKELGYEALALTDNNVMYGVLDFYHACQKYGVKPLIGLTLKLNGKDQDENELILIAKNRNGYQNLLKISSAKMSKEGFEAGDAPINLSEIKNFTADIIAIVPENSKIDKSIMSHQFEQAKNELNALISLFSQSNVFLGVNEFMDDNLIYNLRQLQNQVQVPLIATSFVKYLKAEEKFNVEVLKCIGKTSKLSDEQLAVPQNGKHFLKSPEEFMKLYVDSGLKDAYEQNCKVVDEINVELDFPKTQLPHYPTPNGVSSESYLKNLCQKGLQKRIQHEKIQNSNVYQERLNHELEVIHRMGFDDYFLIVWDVTNFSHKNNILVGPGRGSAAGSLVAYVLYITDVDPIKYDLLFERFLNEERAQMPDIDLDIPDQKRDEIIEYVHQRYGQNHMAQIITYSHLNARQVIRDVSRVMGQNQYEISSWSNALPRLHNIKLKDAYDKSQKLRNLIADSQKNALIYKTALALEGLPRQYSTHAAGIILSDHDLCDFVPLQIGSEGIYLTQFAKEQVEEVGLLKIDFLGLRNLTILENAIQFIKHDYDADFDIREISLNDEATLKLFQNADTKGVFQFESDGIRNVLKRLKPQNFEDIVSTNALYRPGPIQNIDEFIARKNKRKAVNYLNEKLEPILQKTYGIIVYQEQVMQVAAVMGGFSLGQADLLRRAMSKKKQIVIDKMRTQFVNGAIEKGYSQYDAVQVYEFIEHFGNYGFNRSHSVAYSKLAFQLAYIKAHYPAAFYAAILNSVIGNSSKTRDYVIEAKQKGVKIHLPDINQSQKYFILKKHVIYFGFRSIWKIRTDLIQIILSERNENGFFHSVADFIRRIDERFLSDDVLDALIYAGTFDEFGETRNQLLSEVPGILETIKLSGDNVDLMKQLMPKKMQQKVSLSENELLEKEVEYLGTYISGHPVDQYKKLTEIYQTETVKQLKVGIYAKSILYIKNVKVIRTKKQMQMAFVTASDATGEINLTVFPKQFIQFGNLLQEGNVIFVTGKIDERNEKLNYIVNEVHDASKINSKCFYLKIEELDKERKEKLLHVMQQFHGKIPVIIYEEKSKQKIRMSNKYWLSDTEATIQALCDFLGKSNVVLQ